MFDFLKKLFCKPQEVAPVAPYKVEPAVTANDVVIQQNTKPTLPKKQNKPKVVPVAPTATSVKNVSPRKPKKPKN